MSVCFLSRQKIPSNEFVTSLNQATGCCGSGVWDLDQLFEVISKLPPLKRQ
jgi:hypothetical protein